MVVVATQARACGSARSPKKKSALDGDHAPDGLQHRGANQGAMPKLALPLAGFLGQDMALHRVVAFHFVASGQFEALARPSM